MNPTLPSPLPCYGHLTQEAVKAIDAGSETPSSRTALVRQAIQQYMLALRVIPAHLPSVLGMAKVRMILSSTAPALLPRVTPTALLRLTSSLARYGRKLLRPTDPAVSAALMRHLLSRIPPELKVREHSSYVAPTLPTSPAMIRSSYLRIPHELKGGELHSHAVSICESDDMQMCGR